MYSIASSQYRVTFPDGKHDFFWSPVWHELDEREEDEQARTFAERMWIECRKQQIQADLFRQHFERRRDSTGSEPGGFVRCPDDDYLDANGEWQHEPGCGCLIEAHALHEDEIGDAYYRCPNCGLEFIPKPASTGSGS